MRLRNVWIVTLGVALAASVVACGGGEPSNKSADASAPAGTPSGQKVDTSKAGNVTGTVSVDGAVPKNDAIKMNADPVCIKENKDPQFQETYTVSSDGKTLGNVFVYVKDGLGSYVYDTPTDKAQIDQKQLPLPSRTCSACASARRSRSSTAIRRCTTSTHCRRAIRNSIPGSQSRA